MAFITSRDMDIFRVLSSGPMTAEQIISELKRVIAKNPEDDTDGKKKTKHDMSYAAFQIRISKLKKDGYIASRIYCDRHGKGVHALYALTPHSAAILIERESWDARRIRYTLPNKWTVAHEMQVVAVVKAIKRESAKVIYDFSMEDENSLKSASKGAKKRMPYPDLFIRFTFQQKDKVRQKSLGIEIDNGTLDERLVAAKAHTLWVKNRWMSFIICTHTRRIEKLREHFSRYIESEKKHAKKNEVFKSLDDLYERVYFGTFESFVRGGFVGTKWITIRDGEAPFL